MPFKIVRNDITKVKADIIVNTANPKPIYASGTDAAIYHAAGVDVLLAERKKIGEIARGDIAVTPAFNHLLIGIINTHKLLVKGFSILRSLFLTGELLVAFKETIFLVDDGTLQLSKKELEELR